MAGEFFPLAQFRKHGEQVNRRGKLLCRGEGMNNHAFRKCDMPITHARDTDDSCDLREAIVNLDSVCPAAAKPDLPPHFLVGRRERQAVLPKIFDQRQSDRADALDQFIILPTGCEEGGQDADSVLEICRLRFGDDELQFDGSVFLLVDRPTELDVGFRVSERLQCGFVLRWRDERQHHARGIAVQQAKERCQLIRRNEHPRTLDPVNFRNSKEMNA